MSLYFILLFVVFFEAIAQSSVYYANKTNNKWFILIGMFSYAILCLLIFKAYNYKGVGMINAIWSGMSLFIMVSTGVIIFKEKISIKEYIGILFIILGILIINQRNIIHIK
jgi:multidrug transporter EmrE-like cation transporter